MKKFSVTELNKILNDKRLVYLSGFISSAYVFNVECLDCHNIFSTSLYSKSKCRNCKRLKEFQYYSNVIQEIGFAYIEGKYETKKSMILVSCRTCNYKFFTSIKRIIRGDGCARCSRKEKLSVEKIVSLMSDRCIDLLSTVYENSHSKLIWRCTKCGFVWESNWDNIREGHGCPQCNKLIGKKNPRWRGNSKIYPAEWNHNLKEFIRNRDSRKCQFPLCAYTDIGNKKLHVHHINGIKENCTPSNLISLCSSHHQYIETHAPRNWEDYFYAITDSYEIRG